MIYHHILIFIIDFIYIRLMDRSYLRLCLLLVCIDSASSPFLTVNEASYFQTSYYQFSSQYYNTAQGFPGNVNTLSFNFNQRWPIGYQFVFNLNYLIMFQTQIYVLITLINNTQTSAIVQAYSPLGTRILRNGITYLIISKQFPFLAVDYKQISITTNYAGLGINRTMIQSKMKILSTISYLISFTGYKFLMDTTGSYSLNVFISYNDQDAYVIASNISCKTNYNAQITFFILYWNSTTFNLGNGITGSLTKDYMNINASQSNFISNSSKPRIFSGSNNFFGINLVSSYFQYKIYLFSGRWRYLHNKDGTANFISDLYWLTINIYPCNSTITPYLMGLTGNGTCVDMCPFYYYNDDSIMQCLLCLANCPLCTNSSVCLCYHYICKGSKASCSCCGNGIIEGYEHCDDGNNKTGDGCSSSCSVEIWFCPVNNYYNSTIQACTPCPLDCLYCQSFTVCVKCKFNMRIVTGGCTNMPGCIEVYSSVTSSLCKMCSDDFYLAGSICTCSTADFWVASNHCTNITGCLIANRLYGENVCSLCSYRLNFYMASWGCDCISGYYLKVSNSTCLQTCGDGRNFQYACDDGNNLDGDGCSSICAIERNFSCSKGSSTSPSVCIYIGTVTLKLVSINRVLDQNQGVFVFYIIPTSLFSIVSLVANVSFNTSQITSLASWNTEDKKIKLLVSYSEDIEGKMANVSMKLSSRILNSKIQLNMLMQSDDAPLILSSKAHFQYLLILQDIYKWYSASVLFTFFVSLAFHKMIGVEIVTVIQVIYFLTYFDDRQTIFSTLGFYLPFTNLNIPYLLNSKNNFYSPRVTSAFSSYNLTISQLIATLGLLSILFFSLLRRTIKTFLSKQQSGIEVNQGLLTQRVYDHLLFPMAVGFMYVNIFSKVRIKNEELIPKTINLVGIGVAICVYSSELMQFSNKVKLNDKRRSINQCDAKYISLFLIYSGVIHTAIILGTFNLTQSVPEIVLASTIAYLVWFVMSWPYQSMIYNIGQLANLMIVFFASGWIALKKISAGMTDESNQCMFIIVAVLPTMLIALLLTVIRTAILIKEKILQCNIQRERVPQQQDKHGQEFDDFTKLSKTKKKQIKQQLLNNQIENQFNRINHSMLPQIPNRESFLQINKRIKIKRGAVDQLIKNIRKDARKRHNKIINSDA